MELTAPLCSSDQLRAWSATSSQPSIPAMKCVRPGYSFSSVAEAARFCSFSSVLFNETGLMWSLPPAISSKGARDGFRKSTLAGDLGLKPA